MSNVNYGYQYPQQNLMQQAQYNQNQNQNQYNANAMNQQHQQQQPSYPPPQPPMPMQQPPPAPQQQPLYSQQQQQYNPNPNPNVNPYGANQNQNFSQQQQPSSHPLAQGQSQSQSQSRATVPTSMPMTRGPYIDPETQIAYPCNNPSFEGWLTKQSMWLKDWRRRYFLLSGSRLFFAKNAFSAPHGMIDLSTATTVKSADVKSRKKNSFEVSTHDMTYLMYADTEKEKDDWIGSVGRSIVRASGTFLTKNDVKGAGSATNSGGGLGGGTRSMGGGNVYGSGGGNAYGSGGGTYGYGDDDGDDDDGVFENSENHPYFND